MLFKWMFLKKNVHKTKRQTVIKESVIISVIFTKQMIFSL